MTRFSAFLLLTSTLLTACTSGFEPLATVEPVTQKEQRVVPADPVYGIVSYSTPLVMTAPSADRAMQGETRDLPPRELPGLEALQLAQEAEANGDSVAMLQALQQAAEQGSAEAHYQLARHYQNGAPTPEEQTAALTHLSFADAMGHAEATRVLAWHYLRGIGVDADIDYGTRLLEKAAWGSVRAQREAGLLYLNIYTPHLNDSKRGLELLKAASDSGDSPAVALYKHALNTPQRPLAESPEAIAPAAATDAGLPPVDWAPPAPATPSEHYEPVPDESAFEAPAVETEPAEPTPAPVAAPEPLPPLAPTP